MASLLLVEDEQALLRSMRDNMPWHECGIDRVYTASNGMEALELFRRHPTEVVVTDIQMPGMLGIDLARQLQALGHPVSIIFISAYSDALYLKRAISLKATDYLFKPVEFAELKRIILHALRTMEANQHHLESSAMVHTYTDELKIPVLASLLLKRTEADILAAQLELVGLSRTGEAGCWSVLFSPDAARYGKQHLLHLARRHLDDLVLETFYVDLDQARCALVIHLSARPKAAAVEALDLQAAQWLQGDAEETPAPRTPVVDELTLLYGMGSEFIRQQGKESFFHANSLANPSALCQRIVDDIQAHYMDPALSATAIAQAMHYTVSYICSVFKREYQQTIHCYINKVRLDNACRLLETTRLRVGNIAELTGYENEAYFSRVFKKEIGQTPLEYRRKNAHGAPV